VKPVPALRILNGQSERLLPTSTPPATEEAPMMDDPLNKPLMRVRQGKLIAGVCGGIAKWLDWDPTLVRLGYVVLTVVSAGFPGVLIYLLLWILMPQEPA
jgi:phage shock protein PspC (stress-responsive transcriptional regulator)